MVVHMTFNHLCRSSTLLYPSKWPYVNGRQIDFQSNSVDSSSTGHIFDHGAYFFLLKIYVV